MVFGVGFEQVKYSRYGALTSRREWFWWVVAYLLVFPVSIILEWLSRF